MSSNVVTDAFLAEFARCDGGSRALSKESVDSTTCQSIAFPLTIPPSIYMGERRSIRIRDKVGGVGCIIRSPTQAHFGAFLAGNEQGWSGCNAGHSLSCGKREVREVGWSCYEG
jgi:hypothetical protein